jgi:hypothetical protein
MKKHLLALSSLLFTGLTFSQVVFNENFDAAAALPAGWVQYNVDGLTPATNVNYMGTNAWVIRANSATGVGNHAVSTSWYVPAGISNDWLVTPQIAIPGTGSYQVEFDAMAPDAAYLDGFKVYISTTGNAVANFGTTPVLTQAAAPNTYTHFSIPLTAYAGQNIYVAVQNNSNDKFLLFLDNFKVRQPSPDDAILNSTTLNRYSLTSTNNNLGLRVTNDGANPISNITVNWNDGTDHISTIPVTIAPGASTTINHPTPVTYASVVEKNIAVTITNVNGNVDPIPSNNTDSKLFNTVSANSAKNVVIEEGTGTWCGWCPRGAVAMDYMTSTYPNDFIGVAVHNGDPMTVTDYDAGANFSGYPGSNVDRVLLDQSVSQSAFEGYYNARKNLIVPAAMDMSVNISGAAVTMNVTATFKTNFAAANYRLGVIIAENSVSGTTTAYDQTNYYAANANGAMGGYESMADPVPAAQMVYDHVGRALLGGYSGQAGSVPAVSVEGATATNTFNYFVPSTSIRANMYAVAVLIDQTTGEIVNAKKSSLTSAQLNESSSIDMVVFPNPASEKVTVSFEAKNTEYVISITDIQGRTVLTQTLSNVSGAQSVNLPIQGLASGNYIVSVATAGQSFNQMISIK